MSDREHFVRHAVETYGRVEYRVSPIYHTDNLILKTVRLELRTIADFGFDVRIKNGAYIPWQPLHA